MRLFWLQSCMKQVWLWLKRLNFPIRIFPYLCVYVFYSSAMPWRETLCSAVVSFPLLDSLKRMSLSFSKAARTSDTNTWSDLLKDWKSFDCNFITFLMRMYLNSHTLWIKLGMYFSVAFNVTLKLQGETLSFTYFKVYFINIIHCLFGFFLCAGQEFTLRCFSSCCGLFRGFVHLPEKEHGSRTR